MPDYPTEWRRALELLASSTNGRTALLLLAHGVTSATIAGLIDCGRRQIVEMIGAESQRQRRVTVPRLKESIARLLKALEKELASLDTDIDDAVRGSPAWRDHRCGASSAGAIMPSAATAALQ